MGGTARPRYQEERDAGEGDGRRELERESRRTFPPSASRGASMRAGAPRRREALLASSVGAAPSIRGQREPFAQYPKPTLPPGLTVVLQPVPANTKSVPDVLLVAFQTLVIVAPFEGT